MGEFETEAVLTEWERLAQSSTKEAFDDKWKEMKDQFPLSLINYLDKQWISKKEKFSAA
jgi:hypothetical protein